MSTPTSSLRRPIAGIRSGPHRIIINGTESGSMSAAATTATATATTRHQQSAVAAADADDLDFDGVADDILAETTRPTASQAMGNMKQEAVRRLNESLIARLDGDDQWVYATGCAARIRPKDT